MDQIISRFSSPYFYGFCVGLTVVSYFGKKILNKYKEKKQIEFNTESTLYFLLHFGFNMFCVSYTISNVISTFNNPLVINKSPNTLPFYVFMFHIYHILLMKGNIATDEWLHHIKVFMLCPVLAFNCSNLCDFGMFFTTGLPGGCTYLLLFLKNLKLIAPNTEKYVSKHLNMWIRAPGCVITSYIVYMNYIFGNFGQVQGFKKFGVYLAMFGTLWNGMYFASTIIERNKIAQEIEKKKIMPNTEQQSLSICNEKNSLNNSTEYQETTNDKNECVVARQEYFIRDVM